MLHHAEYPHNNIDDSATNAPVAVDGAAPQLNTNETPQGIPYCTLQAAAPQGELAPNEPGLTLLSAETPPCQPHMEAAPGWVAVPVPPGQTGWHIPPPPPPPSGFVLSACEADEVILDWAPTYDYPPVAEGQQRPVVWTSGRHISEVASRAVAELHKAWGQPLPLSPDDRQPAPLYLFQMGGRLCRLVPNDDGKLVSELVTVTAMTGILDRLCDFRTSSGGKAKAASPARAVVEDVLEMHAREFPPLQTLTDTPMLRADGTIITQAGYDAANRVFYQPLPAMLSIVVPERPLDHDIAQALALLEETFVDFPFQDEASRANILALCLTPVVRPLIDGPVPLALLDAPTKGSGKSLLAEVVSVISTGDRALMDSIPEGLGHEAELDKRLTALLMAGPSVIVFDNADGPLRSKALERVLTASRHRGRILGKSQMIDLPVQVTWMATGNNIAPQGALDRRSYVVRLDPERARAWSRDPREFRHPDLLRWVREQRPQLVSALLTLARAWVCSGSPPQYNSPMMGSFESWCAVVGGILGHAGVSGFLGNRHLLDFASSAEDDEWFAFLMAWRQLFADRPVTVREVADAAYEKPGFLKAIPDGMVTLHGEVKRQLLGDTIHRRRDCRFGSEEENLRLVVAGKDSHTRQAQYVVLLGEEKTPADIPAPPPPPIICPPPSFGEPPTVPYPPELDEATQG